MLHINRLAKDCEFEDVTAVQYRDDMIRDSFINGLCSSEIRQRLLEHKTQTRSVCTKLPYMMSEKVVTRALRAHIIAQYLREIGRFFSAKITLTKQRF